MIPRPKQLVEAFPDLGSVEFVDLDVDGPHGPVPARRTSSRAGEPPTRSCGCTAGHSSSAISTSSSLTGSACRSQPGVPGVALDYRKALNGVAFPVPSDDVLAGWRYVRRARRRSARRARRTSTWAAVVPGRRSPSASPSVLRDERRGASRPRSSAPTACTTRAATVHDELLRGDGAPSESDGVPTGSRRQINLRYAGDEATSPTRMRSQATATCRGSRPCTCSTPRPTTSVRRAKSSAASSTAAGVTVEVEFETGTAHGHLNERVRPGRHPQRRAHRRLDRLASRLSPTEPGSAQTSNTLW